MNEQSNPGIPYLPYLQRYGYSPQEAHFLSLAALHSGYFVASQFTDFLRQPRGASTQRFLDKLALRRHASCERYQGRRLVYHIGAQSIYQRLGQSDNRNRRNKAPLTIKRRLMCLDFVLSHLGYRFLATEAEKLDHFLVERQLAIDLLPARHFQRRSGEQATERFFVDKQPIYLLPAAHRDAVQTVGFAYVDEGARTIQGFETFLEQLRPMCDALGRFEIVYAAADSDSFSRAEGAFRRVFISRAREKAIVLSQDAREAVAYFEIRRRFETRNFVGLTHDRLMEYREQKHKFAGAQWERLYERWKENGAADLARHNPAPRDPRFLTQLLGEDYDMFQSVQYAEAL